MVAVEIERAPRDATRVSLGLREGVLRADGEPLGLNHPEDLSVHAEGVVSRAVVGFVLGDSLRGELTGSIRRDDRPPTGLQPAVDPPPAGLPLAFLNSGTRHVPIAPGI